MKTTILNRLLIHLCFISLLFLPLSVSSQTIGKAKKRLSSLQIVKLYLAQDCGSGDKNPKIALQKVLKFKRKTIPILFQFLKQGPSKEMRIQQEQDAKASFAKLQRFIQQDGLSALKNTKVKKAVQRLNVESYVDMRMRSFVSGYQERALNALIATRDPKVKRDLKKINRQSSIPVELQGIIDKIL